MPIQVTTAILAGLALLAIPGVWGGLFEWAWSKRRKIPAELDVALEVMERAIVLLIGVGMLVVIYQTCFASGATLRTIVTDLDTHWKGATILVVPLFYRTMRQWIENAQEMFSIKQKQSTTSTETGAVATEPIVIGAEVTR